eukprot:TRINITY_DN2452_c0_g1_i1.p1 TRINITY_DN2452_c0_g1~~TRINITY_DN2452_c0_g1_i1.p1  ORF type:complete len:238 (+),score=41.39 TRINITY_DN2452_c0_g1_i1:621-1334(+)
MATEYLYSDLQEFDYHQWNNLHFRHAQQGAEFTQEEFNSIFTDLTYTTALSDGTTRVELLPGGENVNATYEDRWKYTDLALRARLGESVLQICAIRAGMCSIVSERAIGFLTPAELELKVCGRPGLDIKLLRSRTLYAPKEKYSEDSQIIKDFWKVLYEISDEERAKFLQFAWARTRLPSDMNAQRMQLSILEAEDADKRLPTSETCFFNVNVPHYSDIDIMRARILYSIECMSITF